MDSESADEAGIQTATVVAAPVAPGTASPGTATLEAPVDSAAATAALPEAVALEVPGGPVEPAPNAPSPLDAAVFQAPFDPLQAGDAPAASAAPASARVNLLALLGVIFALPVWPVGLVLSTLGLLKAYSRRTGKVLAVIGLVLSLVSGGAVIALLSSAKSTVASSTALDPACISIEGKLTGDLATLKADAVTLSSNEDSAASSTSSMEIVGADLTQIQNDLDSAGDHATHAAVKTDLNSMVTQVEAVGSSLTAIESHATSSEGSAAAAMATLQHTDTDLDALCGTY